VGETYMDQGPTEALKQQMQRVGLTSFRALSKKAGISRWHLGQLRQGNVGRIRLENLLAIAQALEVPLSELLGLAGVSQALNPAEMANSDYQALKAEYQCLEDQFHDQRQALWAEFQHLSLQTLESWLRNWPNAVRAAQRNPDLAAQKLVPLVQPVEALIEQWGLTPIASLGSEVPYDPRWHQVVGEPISPGTVVKVRRTGYRQGDRLLHRAEVETLE